MRPSFLNRNNEMVLDTRSVLNALPYSIDGFFYLSTMGAGGVSFMKGVRAKFTGAYSLSEATTPPLVEIDFTGGAVHGDTPFRLVS